MNVLCASKMLIEGGRSILSHMCYYFVYENGYICIISKKRDGKELTLSMNEVRREYCLYYDFYY